jgi:RNA polymerase sigma factor (sigma-70 family)
MADVEGIGDRSSFRRWDLAWDHFERSGDDRDLEEAIQIARRAVEIASGGSGEEAAALSNLGAALLRRSERTGQSADLGEATEVLRRAVSVAPSSGPQRDAVISSLGDALRRRIEGARDPSAAGQTEQFRRFVAETAFVYEEVVAARTRTLGADHPDTLASMNNLAAVLQDQGELEAARQLHERVLTTVRRVLGEDHLSTLASLNNLAAVLQDQGDLVGARSLYEQVLEARRRVLGADHPSVLASMNNLATVLQDQGDLVGARSLYEQVIEARRRVLGADHPSVLASMNNLATVLQDQGDTETAKTLQARVLATMVAEQAVEGGVMAALSAAAESSSAQAGLGKPQKERYEPAQPPTTALALRSPDEYDLVIQRVQEGDAAAWQELMERYNPLVIVVAHRYSLAPADIEDVMQTVWLLLFEQIRQHRSPEELPGWLATVTRRECLRHLRAKGNTPSSLPDEVEQPAKSAWSDEVAELVELDMQRAAVRDAFQRLAPSCQQLLALLLEEPSRSYQEISSSLGMPIGSIGPRRARCLDHLRRLIQAGGA